MPLKYYHKDKELYLQEGLRLTRSTGWKRDAFPVACYKADDAGHHQPTLHSIVVFQNFDPNGADMHIGCEEGEQLLPGVVKTFIQWAFHPAMLGLPKVWAHISEDNIKAQRAALRCGFAFEYRSRGSAPGGLDAIVFSISRFRGEPSLTAQHDSDNSAKDGD